MKILDFGIAKLNIDQKQTATGVALGTPLYMAPEQWEAKADMDGRVDVYALGMILYECVTGTYPFEANSALQLMYAHTKKPVPDPGERAPLPERLRRLVLSMVQKQPEERPASMGVIEAELALILGELGGGAGELSPIAAGPPRPLAATGDPILSFTAEPSGTGSGLGFSGSLSSGAMSAAGVGQSAAGGGASAVELGRSAAAGGASGAGTGQSAAGGGASGAGTGQSAAGGGASGAGVGASAVGGEAPGAGGTQSGVGVAPSAAGAGQAAGPQGPGRRRRRSLLPVLLVGGGLVAAGVVAAVALSLPRRPTARPTVAPAAPAAAVPAGPRGRENRLVELGPGRFLIGRAQAEASDGPAYPFPIGRFAIEAYEVSAGQLAEYVQAVRPPGLTPPSAAAIAADLPAVQLTREQALRYCAWRYPGGTLPTEAEWEYAARSGRSERLLPWAGAADAVPSRAGARANVGSASPQLEPVDSRPQGASSAGIHNLIGNAAEWTLSDSAPYPGSRVAVPRGLAVVRGGSAATPAQGLLATTRQFVAAGRTDPFLGFRCAVRR